MQITFGSWICHWLDRTTQHWRPNGWCQPFSGWWYAYPLWKIWKSVCFPELLGSPSHSDIVWLAETTPATQQSFRWSTRSSVHASSKLAWLIPQMYISWSSYQWKQISRFFTIEVRQKMYEHVVSTGIRKSQVQTMPLPSERKAMANLQFWYRASWCILFL